MNSRTSRPRSPMRAMTLTSASVWRAIMPRTVLLPTPLPEKMPTRCPRAIVTAEEHKLIEEAVKAIAQYESSRDLIEVGAYRAGTNPQVDRAIKLVPELEKFIAQRPDEAEPRAAAMARLQSLIREK